MDFLFDLPTGGEVLCGDVIHFLHSGSPFSWARRMRLARSAIDGSNDLVPKSVSPVGRPAVVNQTVPDVTPPPPRVPAFDLSLIDTEIPDLGWF
jgi:hypothetical protein